MRRGQKACWVATETKKGWRLKLAVGNNEEYPVRGLLLRDTEDVARATADLGVVHVHMAGCNCKEADQ